MDEIKSLYNDAQTCTQIAELEVKLQAKKLERAALRETQEKIESIFEKLEASKSKITSGLDQTVDNVKQKLAKVDGAEKFKQEYLEAIKSKVYSEESYKAIECITSAITAATKKCLDLDDEIEALDVIITTLENQIADLKAKL